MRQLAAALFLFSLLFTACKSGGKKSMKGDQKVDATDFISFFDDIKLPFSLSDSIFIKKANDSSLIETAVFSQFINDSIFTNEFGKSKPKLYAIGKFQNKKAETYLIFRASSTSKQYVYVAAVDQENRFKAAMPFISSNGVAGRERLLIDSKYNFTHATDTKAADGSGSTVSQVYAYNTAGLFMVILTDGVPAGTDLPIVDPIDTLPRKSKYAANYAINNRNVLSIRDGNTAQQFRFFIHIEKKEPHFCDGEIKGVATFIGTDSATYIANGDPCTLGFKFSSSTIHITESNCGNRRGMECKFEGSFTKQKTPAKPKEKKAAVKTK